MIKNCLLLMICFICFSEQNLLGQVPLKALYEEFTSSTCGPCRLANEILDPLLAENESTHSVVKYQVNWPGDGDPYFIPEITSRVDYYSVVGAPTLVVNGQENNLLFDFNQILYDQYTTELTYLEIDVLSAEIDSENILTLDFVINALDNYDAGLRTYVMITEGKTFNNVESNGELEFYDVLLQMLPGEGGTILPAMTTGENIEMSMGFDMDDTFMETPNDLKVIVFVQDDSTKRIIQSENKEVHGTFETNNIKLHVEDSEGNIVSNAKIFLEDHGFAYTDALGDFTYEGSFAGSYEYKVTYPGLLDAEGTIMQDGEDVIVEIEMEIPDYYYYEDFGLGLPPQWNTIFGNNDAVYWYEDRVILFRQSLTLDPVFLVSPVFEVDSIRGGELIFSLGEQSSNPEIGFGTMVGTLSSAVELQSFIPPDGWADYSYDLSSIDYEENQVKFYWNIKNDHFSFASIRYVIITKGTISSVDIQALKNTLVYPNPVSDLLHVEMDNQIDLISIFNSQGQAVMKMKGKANKMAIDISRLVNGHYSVQISNKFGTVLKPIIKN